MKYKDVTWIAESKYKELYDLLDHIMKGVYMGKLTYAQAIDIIHDLIAEEIPDGECANEQTSYSNDS